MLGATTTTMSGDPKHSRPWHHTESEKEDDEEEEETKKPGTTHLTEKMKWKPWVRRCQKMDGSMREHRQRENKIEQKYLLTVITWWHQTGNIVSNSRKRMRRKCHKKRNREGTIVCSPDRVNHRSEIWMSKRTLRNGECKQLVLSRKLLLVERRDILFRQSTACKLQRTIDVETQHVLERICDGSRKSLETNIVDVRDFKMTMAS